MITAAKDRVVLKELFEDGFQLDKNTGFYLNNRSSTKAEVMRYEVINIGKNDYEFKEGDEVLALNIGLIPVETPEGTYVIGTKKCVLAKIIK